MKWSVTILITLGLLAGLSAAILVKFIRSDDSGADVKSVETEVVLVSEDLGPMTVLKASHLTVKSVSKKKAPAGFLSDPVQAVGRILAVPVVKEQMLTESCFVKDGSRAQVAAMLPDGMRAVSLSLTSSSISGGLLYPGCVVDVLASFRLSSSERGEALSTTLLRSINVLAVEGTSVVSQKEEEEKSPSSSARSAQSRLTVTLMVDPKQAEALQLANSQGTISLALRNPLDKGPVDTEATVLSQGRLAQLGSAMAAAIVADETGNGGNGNGDSGDGDGTDVFTTEGTAANGEAQISGTTQKKNVRKNVDSGKLSWPVTVIRGASIQQQDLDLPELKISANVAGSR